MSSGSRQEEFLPVRGLGNVLVVVLAVVVAATLARLAIELMSLENVSRRYSFLVGPLDAALIATVLVSVVLFLIWFYRARINAERCGFLQRRARSWAFWGWIVPIVSLWIPFQVMGDIWRAGLPPWRRLETAWLPALWWTSWLLSGVAVGPATPADSLAAPHISAETSAIRMCFLAIAGALLIAIVRVVSRGPVGSVAAMAGEHLTRPAG
jgi:hypothetical protein